MEKTHKSLHFSLESSVQSQMLNSDSCLSNHCLPQQPGLPVLQEGQCDLGKFVLLGLFSGSQTQTGLFVL